MTCSFAEVNRAENALIMAQREHAIGTAGRMSGDGRRWRETKSGGTRGWERPRAREKADASGSTAKRFSTTDGVTMPVGSGCLLMEGEFDDRLSSIESVGDDGIG